MQTAVKEQWHSLSLPPRVAAPKPPPLHEEAETGVEVGVQQAGWREAFHKRLTKQILPRQTRYDRSTIQHLLQGRSNVFFRVFCHVLSFAFLTQGIIKAKNCKFLWKRWCLCTARVHRATNRQYWQTGVSHVQKHIQIPAPLIRPPQRLPAGNPTNLTAAFSFEDSSKHTQEFMVDYAAYICKKSSWLHVFTKSLP